MGKTKGITVELGGDVSGLDKALKTVNRSIGSTQTELKKVDRLLKLDPTNTELLKQKQDLLSQAVGDTTEKLEALKRAKAKADQDMANGTEVSEKQYRKLQQEIASTEQALKGLEKQAAASNSTLSKISSVSGKMADVSGKIGNAMMPITAAVAAGAAAAAASLSLMAEVSFIFSGSIPFAAKITTAAQAAAAMTFLKGFGIAKRRLSLMFCCFMALRRISAIIFSCRPSGRGSVSCPMISDRFEKTAYMALH